MSKNMVKTQNRQRVQEGLLSFKDNGNNTAKIGDIPSNISVEGTRLDENLLNGMQQGLIFTVDSNMTAKAGYDSYELGILGMAGADNLNGFPIFSGFSLKFKAGATNTQGVVKVKISGTEYDLVKTFGTSVNAIASREIKQGNIYDITFDGVRFSIFQNNINAYGLEAGTVLEGSRLAEALGVKKYGGLITQAVAKYADWAYYEPSMHEIFYCKVNNTEVTPVADKFEPFSNRSLIGKIESLKTVTMQGLQVFSNQAPYKFSQFKIPDGTRAIAIYSKNNNDYSIGSVLLPYPFLNNKCYVFVGFSAVQEITDGFSGFFKEQDGYLVYSEYYGATASGANNSIYRIDFIRA